MNKLPKQLLILLIIFIIFIALVSKIDVSFTGPQKIEQISFNKLVSLIEEEQVTKLTISPQGNIEGTLKDGGIIKSRHIGGESLVSTLKNYEVPVEKLKKIDISASTESEWGSFLGVIIPIILPFALLGGLLYLFYKHAQGISNKTFSFGASAGKQINGRKGDGHEKQVKTTFKDVAGIKEAKEELLEIIEFLKNPTKFTSLGARIPRGVLLIGPPGCGKTLLAKAVAGEAEVPFFHISGSEFMELFVGVGASRVRSLFQRAKRNAPCIIFIDELDSIGRRRGSGFGGSHDERDQTLNQILVEMDGFETDTNVIVMAATNRPDVLDSALLRPGRFDRRVTLELPDIADRIEILKVHATGKPLAKDVNLRRVAERTPGLSGADLSNLMNEAAILSARRNKKEVGMGEIIPSIEKALLGPERKSRILSDEEKKITAYHEGGHAIVSYMLPHTDPIHKISIIARGQAGGYTLKVPERDKHLHTKAEFLDDLSVAMGGLAAEKFKFNEMTTGASGDLMHATNLARRLVTYYGMSDIVGPMSFQQDTLNGNNGFPWEDLRNNYSNETLETIDKEISKILKTAYNTASQIIGKEQEKLEKIAQKLLVQETIEKEEFEEMMKG